MHNKVLLHTLKVLVPVLLLWNGLQAQSTDTLLSRLSKMPPTERLATLTNMAEKEARKDVLKAKNLWENALQLADSMRVDTTRLEILVELSSLQLQLEEFAKAQQHLQNALLLANSLQNDTLLIDIYTLQGIVLERTEKYEEALDWLRKAGQMQQKLKMGPEARARNLTNIGHVYEQQKRFRKAIETYTVAYQLCRDNGIFFGEALLSQNLANAHNEIGMYKESIAYSEQSLQIAQQHDLSRIIVAAYQNLGASRMAMQAYATATELYEKAVAEARRVNYTKALVDATLQLSLAYEKRGMLPQALQQLQTHLQLKDSVYSAEKATEIERLIASFQAQQREQSIQQLQQEKAVARLQQQRTLLGAAAIVIMLIAAIALIRSRNAEEKKALAQAAAIKELKQQEEARQLEQDKALYELAALKAQMNPHFLFNALNSIQELFITGHHTDANEYLGKFSDLTRATLEASGKSQIDLAEEVQMLTDYLDLEGLRFGEQFEYKIHNHTGYAMHEVLLPPMLVQPYVENAVKHGLLHKQGPKKLEISFSMQSNDTLLVKVADNGVGRQKSAYFARSRPGAHAGFATTATQKRLQLLNKGRETAITVAYEDVLSGSVVAGTLVSISIPIHII